MTYLFGYSSFHCLCCIKLSIVCSLHASTGFVNRIFGIKRKSIRLRRRILVQIVHEMNMARLLGGCNCLSGYIDNFAVCDENKVQNGKCYMIYTVGLSWAVSGKYKRTPGDSRGSLCYAGSSTIPASTSFWRLIRMPSLA